MTLRTVVLGLAALAAALVLAPLSPAKVPKASDYHSLLVSPTNPKELLLGTHSGMFRSLDGGKTWKHAGLTGRDVMNLVQAGSTLWAAGHEVLATSRDGGQTWRQVSPKGLPGLDVHGFSVRPGSPNVVYAEIAGRGQYRSQDGGRTFRLLSPPPASMVMTLSAASNGTLFAGDMQNGIYRSLNGRTWSQTARGMSMAVAVDPRSPRRILATTTGHRALTGRRSDVVDPSSLEGDVRGARMVAYSEQHRIRRRLRPLTLAYDGWRPDLEAD